MVNVALTGQAGAPIGGTFSPDTNTFYVSTSGDDLVHFINTATLTDTQQINPDLTCGTTTTPRRIPSWLVRRTVPCRFCSLLPGHVLPREPLPSAQKN